MGEKEEKDLRSLIAEIPWSAILIPFALALIVVAATVFIVLTSA